MKKYINKVKVFVFSHKMISAIILILVLVSGYWGYGKITSTTGEIQYITTTVQKGMITSSVTGSGQISSLNEISLSTKASGELIYLNATVGQEVKKWTTIARLDSGNAAYELESARISYNDLITVDEDELRQAELAVTEAKEDVEDAYITAHTTLVTYFNEINDALDDIDTLLDGYISSSKTDLSKKEKLLIEKTEDDHIKNNKTFGLLEKEYLNISNETDREKIESMLNDSYTIASLVSQTAKYAQDAVIYLRNTEDSSKQTGADTAYTTVNDIVTNINSVVSALSSAQNDIVSTKRTLENAKIDSAEIKDGPDISELRSEGLSLHQKEEALSNYSIWAPFDGIIATVDVRKNATLSSGTTVVTFITKEKIAEISLNEVDVAKIAMGQKAILTFDALEDLSIIGTVAEIDMIGTVSSGVVSYNVKIAFETKDDRVKPGMSVSASIITDSKTDILFVPSSAIKTQGTKKYVQMFATPLVASAIRSQGIPSKMAPKQIIIETGISDDTNTEIISGLKEGDQIVSRIITSTITTTTQASSLFGGGGARDIGNLH